MLKFVSLISFTCIYLSASAQKASYYKDPTVDFTKFNYFYMNSCPMDIHDLTSPYLIKSNLSDTNIKYFILYNELSLKNLVIIDGKSDFATLLINIYEGTSFDPDVQAPVGYKPKRLSKKSLVIDMLDGSSKQLVWRGWMDLSKIKSTNTYQIYQKAIASVLNNFYIQPVIAE